MHLIILYLVVGMVFSLSVVYLDSDDIDGEERFKLFCICTLLWLPALAYACSGASR